MKYPLGRLAPVTVVEGPLIERRHVRRAFILGVVLGCSVFLVAKAIIGPPAPVYRMVMVPPPAPPPKVAELMDKLSVETELANQCIGRSRVPGIWAVRAIPPGDDREGH